MVLMQALLFEFQLSTPYSVGYCRRCESLSWISTELDLTFGCLKLGGRGGGYTCKGYSDINLQSDLDRRDYAPIGFVWALLFCSPMQDCMVRRYFARLGIFALFWRPIHPALPVPRYGIWDSCLNYCRWRATCYDSYAWTSERRGGQLGVGPFLRCSTNPEK